MLCRLNFIKMNYNWLVFCAFVTLSFFHLSDGYKVLVVFAFPGKSHSILGEGHVRNLLKAGHEVTYITPFPIPEEKNLHVVNISSTLAIMHNKEKSLNITHMLETGEEVTGDLNGFFELLSNIGQETIRNENVQKLLLDPNQKFDAIIIEWFFTELHAGMSAIFDCPFIWFSSVDAHSMILSLVDELPNPAYSVGLLTKHSLPFNFWQRWQELFMTIVFSAIHHFKMRPSENILYNTMFKEILAKRDTSRALPEFDELVYNASLLFTNSHTSMGNAIRLMPNVKAIGGYHIDPDLKPLPKDLQQIMDNAKHGVIYFSMGSNLKSKDWPDVIKRDILKLFGELKQTVLWKFEEDLKDKPKNVHILKWAPQTTILAHPNTKIFITHGGLLSTTETVYFGVPIIGIPVFADQFVNVVRAVEKGYALEVRLTYNLVNDLKAAIKEISSTDVYSRKAKELSEIFHDRPMPPGKELVHWVEHVIKTRGAPHMRSPALMVPWYFKMYLDLWAVVLVTLYAVYFVITRLCCRRKSGVSSKKKNN